MRAATNKSEYLKKDKSMADYMALSKQLIALLLGIGGVDV